MKLPPPTTFIVGEIHVHGQAVIIVHS